MKLSFHITAVLAIAFGLSGCGATPERRAFEYMPDMARGPAYKAYAPNSITRDGLTLQRPVAGTIPRGFRPFHYGPGEEEAARAGRELENPYRATPQTLEEGKALFQTYCAFVTASRARAMDRSPARSRLRLRIFLIV